jgi:hypothetical protein
MNEDIFKTFVRRLCSYYGKAGDKTALAQTGSWYGKVADLPDEPLNWMYDRITDEHDLMPRNVPKLMRGLFSSWLHDNPDRRAHGDGDTPAGCSQCIHGVLYLVRYDLPAYPKGYETVAGCAHCRCRAMPKHMTIYEAQDAGWELRDCMPQRLKERGLVKGGPSAFSRILESPGRVVDASRQVEKGEF